MKKRLILLVAAILALITSVEKAAAQNTSPYWSLAGNSNATSSSKLGTTNGINLRLYTNNAERMRITTSGLIGIGTTSPAQKLDVKGNINLSKGYGVYMENHPVLRVDSVNNNTFLGSGIGAYNTGTGNTATGAFSLYANIIGYYNTTTGAYALYSNTTGGGNVATGRRALYFNTTGNSNTAVGSDALFSNTEGYGNVASGSQALAGNQTGTYNTATGSATMYYNTSGSWNTALGANAFLNNLTGNENVAIGSFALDNTKDASGNTAVGHRAGRYFLNGWNNTFLGAYTLANYSGIYNSVAVGNGTLVTASNQVRIGNSYTTSIGGYTNWTNISDGRVKKNIQENVPGLAFINKLKPITYNLDLDAADKISGVAAVKDKEGKPLTQALSQLDVAARQAKQKLVYTGFVAQDVEKAAKELNYDFSGVDAAKNDKDLYGLRYSDFVAPLVKSVQELSKKNDELQQKTAEIEDLKNDVAELRQMVLALTNGAIPTVTSASATLGQNTPNPATGSTRIPYTLPASKAQAQLLLTDALGRTIRNIPLHGSGSVELNTTTLSAGSYTYSLLLDGKIIATKKLTVAP